MSSGSHAGLDSRCKLHVPATPGAFSLSKLYYVFYEFGAPWRKHNLTNSSILRPGGWIEMEILELRMQHKSCVQLQIYPVMIRQGFRSLGINCFSTAEGTVELLEEASFINTQTTVERIPIGGSIGHADGEVLQEYFKELLLLALEWIEEVADVLGKPHRSSRLSMIEEIRAVFLDAGDKTLNFMHLVRITAQKPIGQPDGR